MLLKLQKPLSEEYTQGLYFTLELQTNYSCCDNKYVLQHSFKAYTYIEVFSMVKKSQKIREKLSDTFELPKDIVLDVSKVIIIGTEQVTVENHKGIVEYSEELIRINTDSCIIKLSGRRLAIKTILQEEITITGEITNIEF